MGKKESKTPILKAGVSMQVSPPPIPKPPVGVYVAPEINRKFRLKGDQYYPIDLPKKAIFLHHTAGTNFQGAFQWWNQTPEHVGTAYVIDRDGTIYEVFDPRGYAYHLGVSNDGDYFEKQGIGIELVSAGFLTPLNGNYMFYPLYPNKSGGRVIPKEEIWILDKPYKGNLVYHKYTDAQIESLISLLRMLIVTFKIDISQFRENFFDFDMRVITDKIPGIWSHGTVTNKSDIFPQLNLIKRISSLISELRKS